MCVKLCSLIINELVLTALVEEWVSQWAARSRCAAVNLLSSQPVRVMYGFVAVCGKFRDS